MTSQANQKIICGNSDNQLLRIEGLNEQRRDLITRGKGEEKDKLRNIQESAWQCGQS